MSEIDERQQTDAKGERVFLRGIRSAEYSLQDELRRIRSLSRVVRARELPWHGGGPQFWNKWLLEPDMGGLQSLQSHMEVLVPGGRSQKHGHQNEALLYVLDGRGYDIHDGARYDYEAGDLLIVHNGCVHQHFNADDKHPLRVLVIKSKPLFMFMNLIFQRTIEPRPKTPVPGWEGWKPGE